MTPSLPRVPCDRSSRRICSGRTSRLSATRVGDNALQSSELGGMLLMTPKICAVCLLTGSHRIQDAIVHSGSPAQCASDIAVCSACLSWAIKKFTDQGNIGLADAWRACIAASVHGESSACCENLLGPNGLRRAW